MTVARRRTPPTAQPIEDHDAPRVHAPSGRFQVRRGAAGAAFPALRRRSKAAPKAERNHFRQRRKWIATKSRGGNKALVPRLLWGSQRASCQRCRRRGKVMLRKGPSRELCLASAVSCAQQPRDARRPPASTASPRNATQSDTPRNDHSSCIQGASVVSGPIRGGGAGGSPPAPGRLGSSRPGAGGRRRHPATRPRSGNAGRAEARGILGDARPPALPLSPAASALASQGPQGPVRVFRCACRRRSGFVCDLTTRKQWKRARETGAPGSSGRSPVPRKQAARIGHLGRRLRALSGAATLVGRGALLPGVLRPAGRSARTNKRMSLYRLWPTCLRVGRARPGSPGAERMTASLVARSAAERAILSENCRLAIVIINTKPGFFNRKKEKMLALPGGCSAITPRMRASPRAVRHTQLRPRNRLRAARRPPRRFVYAQTAGLFGCARRLGTRVSSGLDRLGVGSGCSLIPLEPAGSRPGAHARPGPGRRLHVCCGSVQQLHTE